MKVYLRLRFHVVLQTTIVGQIMKENEVFKKFKNSQQPLE